MSQEIELNLEQLKLSLSDYQSELDAIDAETNREKERILNAIQAEEAEIKSLLEQYRDIKRQKELTEIESSYGLVSNFKQNLLLKIESETQNLDRLKSLADSKTRFTVETDSSEAEGEVKKPEDLIAKGQIVNERVKVIELIQFIEGISPKALVQFYPADIANSIPSFDASNTAVRDELFKYYQKHNISIYNALIKLYQKPYLDESTIDIPEPSSLPLRDRGYHSFLEENYPKSLPFFWFLINREPDTIKYVVMEFAVDHIIQTSTLEDDPDRQELNLKLPELLGMNEQASISQFLRDIFISFHPRRVSQKSNSKNKYFDYVTNLIQTQATLEYSEVLQIWNYMLNSGYEAVTSPDFEIVLLSPEEMENQDLDLVSGTKEKLL